jgi:hypothetical protein
MSKSDKRLSKASRNYIFNLISILPFLFLLISGLIVLRYHSGTEYDDLSFGIDGYLWLKIHRITALVVVPLIIIHLWLHKHWLKRLITLKTKGKFGGTNMTLFFIFLFCVITALLAWLVFEDTKLGEALREVHSKLGLLLIVFFVVHLTNYFRWLKDMTLKFFRKKK